MHRDRMSWFAGGIVLGLLIGAGIVGGFSMMKFNEARAETEEARLEAAASSRATFVRDEDDLLTELTPTETLDFYSLSFFGVRKLDGKSVRISFRPNSRPELLDSGETIVEAEIEPPRYRSVLTEGLMTGNSNVPPAYRESGEMACVRFAKGRLVPDLESGESLAVEGQMRTRIIPARTIDGVTFPKVLEMEVIGARLVRY